MELHHLARQLSDDCGRSSQRRLPCESFGMGAGCAGKTALSKQIVVACCCAGLDGQACRVVPFRVALAEFAPLLIEADGECCASVSRYLEQTRGRDSLHVKALDDALTTAQVVLRVLDGFDEIPLHQSATVALITNLGPSPHRRT